MDDRFRLETRSDYPKILAWDLQQEVERHSFSIFRLDKSGAKHVYGVSIPTADVSHTNKRVEQDGHRIGQYDRWAPFVWSSTDNEIFAWDRE